MKQKVFNEWQWLGVCVCVCGSDDGNSAIGLFQRERMGKVCRFEEN